MNIETAITICNKWLLYLNDQRDRSKKMQALANQARKGPMAAELARKEMRKLDGCSLIVHDAANLELAVKFLILNSGNQQAKVNRLTHTIATWRKTNDDTWQELLNCAKTEIGSQQAKIDSLMLEYCPEDMTSAQMKNWADHQVPVCRRCQVGMIKSKALVSTMVAGAPDFIDQDHTNTRSQTCSEGGPGKLVAVWKCPGCGHSIKVKEHHE